MTKLWKGKSLTKKNYEPLTNEEIDSGLDFPERCPDKIKYRQNLEEQCRRANHMAELLGKISFSPVHGCYLEGNSIDVEAALKALAHYRGKA